VAICLEQGANDLHMVQLMPLLPHHLFASIKSRMAYLSSAAYPGCPGKRPLNRYHHHLPWLQNNIHQVAQLNDNESDIKAKTLRQAEANCYKADEKAQILASRTLWSKSFTSPENDKW